MTRSILIALCFSLVRTQSRLDSACPCTARSSCSRILGEGADAANVDLIRSLPPCVPGLVRCCTRDDLFLTLRSILSNVAQTSPPAVPAPVPTPAAFSALVPPGGSTAANSLNNLANLLGAPVTSPSAADSLNSLAASLGFPVLSPASASLTELARSLESSESIQQSNFFERARFEIPDPLALPTVGGQDGGRSLLAEALREVQNFSPGDVAGPPAGAGVVQQAAGVPAFAAFPQPADVQQAASLVGAPAFAAAAPHAVDVQQQAASLADALPQLPVGPVTIPEVVFPAAPTVPVAPAAVPVPGAPIVPEAPAAAPAPDAPIFSVAAPAPAPILPAEPVVLPALVPPVPAASTFLPTQPVGPAAPDVSIIGPKPIFISNDVVKGPTVGGGGAGSHAAGDGLDDLLRALRQLI